MNANQWNKQKKEDGNFKECLANSLVSAGERKREQVHGNTDKKKSIAHN